MSSLKGTAIFILFCYFLLSRTRLLASFLLVLFKWWVKIFTVHIHVIVHQSTSRKTTFWAIYLLVSSPCLHYLQIFRDPIVVNYIYALREHPQVLFVLPSIWRSADVFPFRFQRTTHSRICWHLHDKTSLVNTWFSTRKRELDFNCPRHCQSS